MVNTSQLSIDRNYVINILISSLNSNKTPFAYMLLKSKELNISLNEMYNILFNYPKCLFDIHNELNNLMLDTKLSYNELFEALFQKIYHKDFFDVTKLNNFDTIIYNVFFEFIEKTFNIAIPILGYIPHNSIINIQKSLNSNTNSDITYCKNKIIFDKNDYSISKIKNSIKSFKLLNIKQPINFIFNKDFVTPFTINKYQNYIFSNECDKYSLIHELGHIIYHTFNNKNKSINKLIKRFKSIYTWEDCMKILIKDITYLDYILNDNEIFARLFEIYALFKLNHKVEHIFKNSPIYFFYNIWSDIDKNCLIHTIDSIIMEFNCIDNIENANIYNICNIKDEPINTQYIFDESSAFVCYQYIKESINMINPKFIMYVLGIYKYYYANDIEIDRFKKFVIDKANCE